MTQSNDNFGALAVEPCKDESCNRHSYQLMLGPLRPDVVVCVHGYRFTRGAVLG